MLKEGKNIALISDAGMPLISDPGATVVKEAQKQGLEYTVISGPCACINAVVLSSLDTSRFCMVGFLPEKEGERKKTLELFKDLQATLVFYSPPHDIDKDLNTLYENLGARKVAVVREISKLYEQVCVGTLGEEMDFMRKGEFVIVVEGARPQSESLSTLSIQEHITHYLNLGKTEKEAIKAVASDRNVAKSIIYAEAVKMKENK
jgi:16S rRNA (cytidine1402-2'-O)-methyltransferase